MTNFLQQAQLMIERYWLWVSTFVIAILSIMLIRDGSKISDLQQAQLQQKLDSQLDTLQQASKESVEDYAKALNDYSRLADHYNNLFPSDNP